MTGREEQSWRPYVPSNFVPEQGAKNTHTLERIPPTTKKEIQDRNTKGTIANSQKFCLLSWRRHTRLTCDWSSDVCSSDLDDREAQQPGQRLVQRDALYPANAERVAQVRQKQRLIGNALDHARFARRHLADVGRHDRIRSEERRVGKEWRSGWSLAPYEDRG